MTDAIKLAIDKAWEDFYSGFDLHGNEWQDMGADETFKAGYLAALRAQPATTPREASDFQKWSVLAYRALDDAGRVLMTVEPECSTESDNLSVLTETIRELMYQALTLNGVLSRRDMDRKFHFGKLDSDALLRAQPDHSEQHLAMVAGWKLVPLEPSDEHLTSMAIRYDHGLGVPGYYDADLFGKGVKNPQSHAHRLEATKRQMRQLYEEAIGEGFHKLPPAIGETK